MIIATPTDIKNRKKYLKGEQEHYTCIMCGSETDLSNSISHQGYNLICSDCRFKIQAVIGESIISKVHKVGIEKEMMKEGR